MFASAQAYIAFLLSVSAGAALLYSIPYVVNKMLEDDYVQIAEGGADEQGHTEARQTVDKPAASAGQALTAEQAKKQDKLERKKQKKLKKAEMKNVHAAQCADMEDLDKICGFSRPQQSKPVANTVDEYQKHLFVCTGKSDWPAYASEDDVAGPLLNELRESSREMDIKIKVNACGLQSRNASGKGLDVLLFPDMKCFYNVTADQVSVLFDHIKMDEGAESANVYPPSLPIDVEPITGTYLFVCTHGGKDRRCGYCGPILVDEFKKNLAGRDDVKVSGISHVGGHVFAGNVLIFPIGDWLGYVTPAVVPDVIAVHINQERPPHVEVREEEGGGYVIEKLWRGRMGQIQSIKEP